MRILTVILALFALFSLTSYGRDEHGDSTSPLGLAVENNTSPARLEADGKLTPKAAAFLSRHFSLPESYIREEYDSRLPVAIEKAINPREPNEAEAAQIISELMGVINLSQVKTLVASAEKINKVEREDKDPEKRDDRYTALMDRLIWAGNLRLGKETDNEKAPVKRASSSPPLGPKPGFLGGTALDRRITFISNPC